MSGTMKKAMTTCHKNHTHLRSAWRPIRQRLQLVHEESPTDLFDRDAQARQALVYSHAEPRARPERSYPLRRRRRFHFPGVRTRQLAAENAASPHRRPGVRTTNGRLSAHVFLEQGSLPSEPGTPCPLSRSTIFCPCTAVIVASRKLHLGLGVGAADQCVLLGGPRESYRRPSRRRPVRRPLGRRLRRLGRSIAQRHAASLTAISLPRSGLASGRHNGAEKVTRLTHPSVILHGNEGLASQWRLQTLESVGGGDRTPG